MDEPIPFTHEPVLADEVVAIFAPVPPGWVLDATVGGAGHAARLLDAHPHLRVVGLDQDPAALEASAARLTSFGARAQVVRARFDRLAEVASERGASPLSGVLFDLGVSSPQLDRAERGFSYRHEGPLDMRMDPDAPLSAADVVNTYDEAELARVLRRHGDEQHARRIAATLVRHRPVRTTAQLAELVRDAIPAPARRRGGHPARRTFQALRIEVNDELAVLARALDAALDATAPGGRVAAITYHSGEDRLVKRRFREALTGGCTCPPRLGCVCGARPQAVDVARGGVTPTDAELRRNPRSESARLRAVELL